MKLLHALCVCVGVASLAGCGPGFVAASPPEFVEIENEWDAYDYRAATADGLVIAVREIEHDPEGTREFWVKAVENRMRDRGGYALLGTDSVKNAQGLEGTRMKFGHDESGHPHLYNVTLFVTEDTIFVIEQGGTKELMERHADQLDWAVQHFHVK